MSSLVGKTSEDLCSNTETIFTAPPLPMHQLQVFGSAFSRKMTPMKTILHIRLFVIQEKVMLDFQS